MKNQPSYITGCIDAINQLRTDLSDGYFTVYEIEQLPSGILPESLTKKCCSAMVGLSGNGVSQYLAIIPQRVDEKKSTSAKVFDSDPIIFATISGANPTFPTGIFVHHSSYDGRTQPISGFDEYTCEQTVSVLRANLTTGVQPLSSTANNYVTAFAHGINQFTNRLGLEFSEWSSGVKPAPTEDINVRQIVEKEAKK